MIDTLKIAVPMAGLGTRMRPHTWSKPKPLVSIAGKTVLDYVIDQFKTVPAVKKLEYIFIIGPQGGQIRSYMEENHPDKVVHYVVQEEMKGQSDALYLAREHLTGPMLMAFSDTLLATDLSFLKDETADGIAWVKPVPDPRRFGVAKVDAQDRVLELIEKPADVSINLALVGMYYFREGKRLMASIEEQFQRGKVLKGEYYLVDALNIMLEGEADFRVHRIDTWLDTGVPGTTLETNRYLLEHINDNSVEADKRPGVTIVPPVFIHEDAQITSSVIGPYVSIGQNCQLDGVIVRNSIIGDNTRVSSMILEDSLLGQQVVLEGKAERVNLGDNSKAVK